jgi:hypothetical protein
MLNIKSSGILLVLFALLFVSCASIPVAPTREYIESNNISPNRLIGFFVKRSSSSILNYGLYALLITNKDDLAKANEINYKGNFNEIINTWVKEYNAVEIHRDSMVAFSIPENVEKMGVLIIGRNGKTSGNYLTTTSYWQYFLLELDMQETIQYYCFYGTEDLSQLFRVDKLDLGTTNIDYYYKVLKFYGTQSDKKEHPQDWLIKVLKTRWVL